jgi:hypothetical protein
MFEKHTNTIEISKVFDFVSKTTAFLIANLNSSNEHFKISRA